MLRPRVIPLPRFLLVAVALSLSFLTPRANAQAPQHQPLSQELDLSAYEAELDRCATAIKLPDAVPTLRKSLPHIWFVRTPDRRLEVSTVWLDQKLEKIEKDPATSAAVANEVEAHLVAMRETARELEAASQQPSLSNARENLDKILQRPEFAGEQGPSQWELLRERIGRWLGDRILRLMRAMHLGPATGNVIAWTVVGLAFLALCYYVFQTVAARSPLPGTPTDAPIDLAEAREWASDALAAAERGDYREAVHCAYWAAVVRLETLGLLKRDRARTPRESLRNLDPHPTEQRLLREFTRHFELIWYGYRPASAQDWSEARAHLEKMGCLTPSTPATANS